MFQPYNLTPLDHAVPAVHFNPILSFSLIGKDVLHVLQRAEDSLARLLFEFPILTGMVVPSTPDGRSNAFQVRPASAAEIEDEPFFTTQNHTQSTALTVDGRLNPVLIPFPILNPPASPSPVLRLKANVIEDKLLLVWCFDHRVMDVVGFLALLATFATFCRDPKTSEPLVTTPDAQEKAREHIEDTALTTEPQRLCWTSFPPPTSGDESFIDSSEVPISSFHVLDARKIKMLYDACTVAVLSLPENYRKSLPFISFPPNLVVSALVGLCGSRARLQAFPNQQDQPSNLLIAANIRKAAELPSYIGNAVFVVESAFDDAALPPPEALENIHVPGPFGTVEPEDIWQICKIAGNLQQGLHRLDKQHVQGMIATMSHRHDWSSFRPGFGGNLHVSDIRAASPYVSYGPLGDLLLFDLPFDAVPGTCWIIPNLPSDAASPNSCWRLRLTLERAATECLLSDPLFRWVTAPSPTPEYAKL
ncbi:hypothetical protein N7475_003316 [Penicillium sp. IBT 31633x]|nr:hypothetical protein N7475_003316 [Penicillium sp. IBT 31633x]